MRVGINGMGRIGRLALRAAMGAEVPPPERPFSTKTQRAYLGFSYGAKAMNHVLKSLFLSSLWDLPSSQA